MGNLMGVDGVTRWLVDVTDKLQSFIDRVLPLLRQAGCAMREEPHCRHPRLLYTLAMVLV